MSLVWDQNELPTGCHVKALSPSESDPSFASGQVLPIDHKAWEIKTAIRENTVVAIKAQTGSGKTMKGPQYLSEEVNYAPVLIVEVSCLAAEKVVSSLAEGFGVERCHLHLRSGIYDKDTFETWTWFSVITYGILWEWLRP